MPTIHLNITQQCNQKCFFCVRSHAPIAFPSVESLLQYAKNQRANGAENCIITGGEPFVVPFIFHLLESLKKLNFQRITIQTNATLLSSEQLVKKLVQATAGLSCDLSISLHSVNDSRYANLAGGKSYLPKIKLAFSLLRDNGVPFCTNTVIFKDNVTELIDIAQCARKSGAYLIQFSLMRYQTVELAPYAASLADIIAAAKQLAQLIPTRIIRFEGMTYCLLRGMEKCVAESYWPHPLRLLTSTGKQIDDYKNDLMHLYRRKMPKCRECMFNSVCMGVWQEYEEQLIEISPPPIR